MRHVPLYVDYLRILSLCLCARDLSIYVYVDAVQLSVHRLLICVFGNRIAQQVGRSALSSCISRPVCVHVDFVLD